MGMPAHQAEAMRRFRKEKEATGAVFLGRGNVFATSAASKKFDFPSGAT
jgi:hypothetical protein